MKKIELWSIVILETLFGLCATSVVIYQVTGRFDFGFGFISYRFLNIAFSVLFIVYLIHRLIKAQKNILIFITLFSFFHFIEGVLISFWLKVVIHLMILLIVGQYFYRNKTIMLKEHS